MNWIREVLKKPRICGQALVEVLLAMSILVSSFIGLLSVHLQSSEWVAESRSLTRAGAVSYSLLEALRGGSMPIDWSHLEGDGWVDLKEAGGGFPVNIIRGQDVYITLQRVENGIYLAGVRVDWRDGKNSVELYTKIRETALKGSPERQGSGSG